MNQQLFDSWVFNSNKLKYATKTNNYNVVNIKNKIKVICYIELMSFKHRYNDIRYSYWT